MTYSKTVRILSVYFVQIINANNNIKPFCFILNNNCYNTAYLIISDFYLIINTFVEIFYKSSKMYIAFILKFSVFGNLSKVSYCGLHFISTVYHWQSLRHGCTVPPPFTQGRL